MQLLLALYAEGPSDNRFLPLIIERTAQNIIDQYRLRGQHEDIDLSGVKIISKQQGGGIEKRYPHSPYYTIFVSRFSGGISRREGFYAPPASPTIPVNLQVYPEKQAMNGRNLCNSRRAVACRRGVKPLPTCSPIKTNKLCNTVNW
jgi:hypothetical protein